MTETNGNGRADVSEHIRDRLVKLLRHAESARQIGNIHEAEAFTDKVSALLLKHKIEMGALNLNVGERDRVDPVGEGFSNFGGKTSKPAPRSHVGQLINVLARAHGCRIFYSGKSICIMGRDGDRATVELLGHSLVDFMEKESYREYFNWWKSNGGIAPQKNYRDLWCQGFVNAIRDRLDATRRTVEEQAKLDGQSTALIVLDDKAVALYATQRCAKMGVRRTTVKSGGAVEAKAKGYAAGQRAQLHRRLA